MDDSSIDTYTQANTLFEEQKYDYAIYLYTSLINNGVHVYECYGKRAQCHLEMKRFKEAIEDAEKAVQLDPGSPEAYLQLYQCAISTGDIQRAEDAARTLLQINGNDAKAKQSLEDVLKVKDNQKKANEAMKNRKFETVLQHAEVCIEYSSFCIRFHILKAEALVYLRQFEEAQEILNNILFLHRNDGETLYIRAMCAWYENMDDLACSYCQKVLQIIPNHPRANKLYRNIKRRPKILAEAQRLMNQGRYEEAIIPLNSAIIMDKNNKEILKTLYEKKIECNDKLNKYEDVVNDCLELLDIQDDHPKVTEMKEKYGFDKPKKTEPVLNVKTGDKEEYVSDGESSKTNKNSNRKKSPQSKGATAQVKTQPQQTNTQPQQTNTQPQQTNTQQNQTSTQSPRRNTPNQAKRLGDKEEVKEE